MGYVKLDDAFLDHPKFLEAGPLAGYLALCAIAWSNRNRTDGFIPAAQVPRLASFDGVVEGIFSESIVEADEVVNPRDLATRLVHVGLWEQSAKGYLIHDYLEWQSSAEHIQQVSTARADAGRKGAEARWGTAPHGPSNRTSDDKPDGNLNGNGDGKPLAKPSQKNGLNEEGRTNEKTPMPSELGAAASRLFEYWKTATSKQSNAKFSPDRRRKVEARLREGYTEEQIRQAIDGAARAAFVNDAGKRFDDLELICRSGSKVEDFMGRVGVQSKSSVQIAREGYGYGGAA